MTKLTTDHTELHTLDSHLAAENAALHNSNMANLASAMRKAEDGIELLQEEIQRLQQLRADIRTHAEDKDAVQDTSITARFYEQADIRITGKRKRW